ncbi:hypothetical protein PR048_018699 [Dryococelus australis]|uniref:Mutator-like transposase domain-containing protein n=1 Tax=Dryococelus australis TaxID=614101 RepID=A0ABQ9HD06_9NEOP|nr:hypothetical protein PR048_018699 [Dryococelus australis]
MQLRVYAPNDVVAAGQTLAQPPRLPVLLLSEVVQPSAKRTRNARWVVIGEPPFRMNSSTAKAQCSPDQAPATIPATPRTLNALHLTYFVSTQKNGSTEENSCTPAKIGSAYANTNDEVNCEAEDLNEDLDATLINSHDFDFVSTEGQEHCYNRPEAICGLKSTSTPYMQIGLSDTDLVTPGCSQWTDNQNNHNNGRKSSKVEVNRNRKPFPESSPKSCINNQIASNSTKSSVPKENITGCRIFYVSHVFNEIKRMRHHTDVFGCDIANIVMVREKRRGMEIIFHFVCNMCVYEDIFSSVMQHNENGQATEDINSTWVNSMFLTEQGYSQLRNITAALDMPCMSKETYNRHQKKLSSEIHDIAWKIMQAAAKEETELALAAGNIDSDGVPLTTFISDGSCCKSSFTTNYNALSGVVRQFHIIEMLLY